jgi:hypothetical protein
MSATMKFDDVIAAANQPGTAALEALLREAGPLAGESASDVLIAVGRAGNADSIELAYRAGARPKYAEELWMTCRPPRRGLQERHQEEGAREPAE